jgi:hypothetical protein
VNDLDDVVSKLDDICAELQSNRDFSAAGQILEELRKLDGILQELKEANSELQRTKKYSAVSQILEELVNIRIRGDEMVGELQSNKDFSTAGKILHELNELKGINRALNKIVWIGLFVLVSVVILTLHLSR